MTYKQRWEAAIDNLPGGYGGSDYKLAMRIPHLRGPSEGKPDWQAINNLRSVNYDSTVIDGDSEIEGNPND